MKTVIFVHGTGVRESNYKQTFTQVKSELTKRQTDLSVSQCYWGQFGAQLNVEGASVPKYDSTYSISLEHQAVTDDEYLIPLWEFLYRDPLYELRLLSLRAKENGGEIVFGQRSPGDKLQQNVKELDASSPNLQTKLEQAGIISVFEPAWKTIIEASAFQAAMRSAPAQLDEYRTATARAIVAQAIAIVEQQAEISPLISTNADLRDEIVELLDAALGEKTLGIIGNWMKSVMIKLASHYGTYRVKNKRGALTDQFHYFLGDILLYQTRGEEIRTFIHQQIQKAQTPVVLLAHSLGGIICVDLLIKEDLPQVELLITAGSQSPYFYEINALHSLVLEKDTPVNKRLPADFPPWLNFYDHRDFLSYVGADVFGSKVTDVEVNNRQPFPQSHSAYWSNAVLWHQVLERIRQI